MNTKLFLIAVSLIGMNYASTGYSMEASFDQTHNNMQGTSNRIKVNRNNNNETRIEKKMRKEKGEMNKIERKSEELMYQYSSDFQHDIEEIFFRTLITKAKNDDALLGLLRQNISNHFEERNLKAKSVLSQLKYYDFRIRTYLHEINELNQELNNITNQKIMQSMENRISTKFHNIVEDLQKFSELINIDGYLFNLIDGDVVHGKKLKFLNETKQEITNCANILKQNEGNHVYVISREHATLLKSLPSIIENYSINAISNEKFNGNYLNEICHVLTYRFNATQKDMYSHKKTFLVRFKECIDDQGKIYKFISHYLKNILFGNNINTDMKSREVIDIINETMIDFFSGIIEQKVNLFSEHSNEYKYENLNSDSESEE